MIINRKLIQNVVNCWSPLVLLPKCIAGITGHKGIRGKVNCDYASTEGHRDVKASSRLSGFKQLIENPTIVTETTSTIIDLTTNRSDDEMVGAIRKKYQHKYQPKTIHSRKQKNNNKENIKYDIENINWTPMFICKFPTMHGTF